MFVGPQAGFRYDRGLRQEDITDGTINTFMIVEATDPVPWTKPDELDYAANLPLPRLGGLHTGGFNAVFFDGRVHFIPQKTDENTLRAYITANGGEMVPPPP